jgi:phage gpG-like protein
VTSDTASPLIQGIIDRARAPHSLLSGIGMQLVVDAQDEIITSGHGEWAPLRARRGRALYNTGRLFASLTYRVGNAEVAVGTATKYASYHQIGTGTFRGRAHTVVRGEDDRGIIARPFLRIPKPAAEMAVIERMVLDYYQQGRD